MGGAWEWRPWGGSSWGRSCPLSCPPKGGFLSRFPSINHVFKLISHFIHLI